MILGSSLMYFAERDAQPEAFPTIIATMWWGMATLSTVGYGDYDVSEQGKRFTMILIVLGLCVVTYSMGQLAPIILNERRAREWKMNRQIRKMQDHFIVCGLVRVGLAVCQSLEQQGIAALLRDPIIHLGALNVTV